MKKIKFPLITLLVAGLFTIAFIGCKKDLNDPSLTSNAKPVTPPGGGGGGGATAFNLVYSTTPAVEGQCFAVTARLENNGGVLVNANAPASQMVITVTDPALAVTTTTYSQSDLQANGGMTFTNSICGAQVGTYTIQICETHTPSPNSTPVNVCTTIYVVVGGGGNCPESGATLLGQAWNLGLGVNGLPNGEIRSEFNVTVCAGSFSGLKLQGGLVAKAVAPMYDNANNPDPTKPWAFIVPDSDGSAYDGNDANNTLNQVKMTNQNWTITWLLNDVAAGYSKTYVIRYHKVLLPGSTGNFVTGQWSLKNNSVLVAGYTDRLVVNY